MRSNTVIALSALIVASLFTGVAHAHGTAKEHDKKKDTVVEKEQTDWGIAGDAANVSRTITVAMLDKMRFDPESVKVKEGETVRFVLQNQGQIKHEFVLGDRKSLDEHAAMMIKFPTMEHEQPYMAHVSPGKSAEIIWQFNRGGDFNFACLIPGHYQAGMIGDLGVGGMSAGHDNQGIGMHDAKKKSMSHGDGHADHGKKKHTE